MERTTITAPLTFESVGLLAAIVGIRTFLSFSLETEIEGCWPWQRAAKRVCIYPSTSRLRMSSACRYRRRCALLPTS